MTFIITQYYWPIFVYILTLAALCTLGVYFTFSSNFNNSILHIQVQSRESEHTRALCGYAD